MANSNSKPQPQKPYPDYPLTPRRDGRWCKKIKGVVYTFTGSATEALDEYKRVCDDLYAGRKPRPKAEGLTIYELSVKFLDAKLQQQQSGEITAVTYKDYRATCKRVVKCFGQNRVAADLAPEDFEKLRAEFSKTCKLIGLGNQIRRTRVLFKYGYDAGMLAVPQKFGPMFKQPTAKAVKRLRAQQRIDGTNKEFTADEIKKLVKAADTQLRAMILLGINCGLGNTDCAKLTTTLVDSDHGWLMIPRSKTGAFRRCPLWPETTKAIEAELAERKTPKDPAHAKLVFLTAHGGTHAKDHGSQSISHLFSTLAEDCNLSRERRGFNTFRHMFRTVAGGAKDVEATRLIMGHDENAVEDSYIESIDDGRLLAVSNHVRQWLYGSEATQPKSKPSKESFQLRIVG